MKRNSKVKHLYYNIKIKYFLNNGVLEFNLIKINFIEFYIAYLCNKKIITKLQNKKKMNDYVLIKLPIHTQ